MRARPDKAQSSDAAAQNLRKVLHRYFTSFRTDACPTWAPHIRPLVIHLRLRPGTALFHFWVTTRITVIVTKFVNYRWYLGLLHGHSSGRSIRRSRTFVSEEKSSN